MKKKICLMLLACFLVGCDNNPSNSGSISNVPTDSVSIEVSKKVVFEKHFSKEHDDNFENFYAKGWSAANAKFGTNSIILLEDETHAYGSGYVRTPVIGNFKNVQIDLSMQVTGFNNASEIDKFVGQTFAFELALMNKINDEYIPIERMTFSHLITQEDANNKHLSCLNPYTSNPKEAKVLNFTSEEEFSAIKISYKNKPHYQSGSKDNGVNLELFSIVIYEN